MPEHETVTMPKILKILILNLFSTDMSESMLEAIQLLNLKISGAEFFGKEFHLDVLAASTPVSTRTFSSIKHHEWVLFEEEWVYITKQ